MVNNEFVPVDAANLYNYATPSYFQRPDKRYSLGAFGHYDISDARHGLYAVDVHERPDGRAVRARRSVLRLRRPHPLRQPAADRAGGHRDGLHGANRRVFAVHRPAQRRGWAAPRRHQARQLPRRVRVQRRHRLRMALRRFVPVRGGRQQHPQFELHQHREHRQRTRRGERPDARHRLPVGGRRQRPVVRAVEHLPDRRRHAGRDEVHCRVVLRDQQNRSDRA